MWVHIGIFILIIGIEVFWKLGWIHFEVLNDKKSHQIFLIVAILGNLLGMYLTFSSGMDVAYTKEPALEKKESGSYEEEFLVSIDGSDNGTVSVKIPAKDSEEETEESLQEEEKTPEEILGDAIALYNEQINDPDYYYLPEKWDGVSYSWGKKGDSSGSILSAIFLFAAFVLLIRNMKNAQEEQEKRIEQMVLDYPGLIMKFTLLIQAGMTARKAFFKIASDYQHLGKTAKPGKRKAFSRRYAYEEVLTTCIEMESGISELDAYRRFGERTGQIKYKTFATLLIQNLQKGSRQLSDILEKESLEAWDERKRKARVLGEAAATKLLFPMILMLSVVMAIVIIPAFLSF